MAGSGKFTWHLFVVLEILTVLLLFAYEKWKEMVGDRLKSPWFDVQENPAHQPALSLLRKRISLLSLGLVVLMIVLIVNMIYHLNILFSSLYDFEKEI